MRKVILVLVLLLVGLSVMGMLDAGYITWETLSGRIPPCNQVFQCDRVLESSYAKVAGIPLSVFGLVFYGIFFLISSWYFLNLETKSSRSQQRLTGLLVGLGVAGVSFSAYLVFVMGVIIQSWCFYCLLSALNCVLLFCTSLAIKFTAGRAE